MVPEALSRTCPACGSSAGTTAGVVNGFAMTSCDECRTLHTASLPPPGESKDYESFYGEGRDVTVPAFVLGRLEDAVGKLAGYRSSLNRWLDIGCGTGTLLEAAQRQGWNPVGTEVAPAVVEAVRARGFDVMLGTTDELDLPEAGFDVVSVVEVLEHVPDPARVLADAARSLRPGGALYLTTPHGRGVSARLLGLEWSVVTPPDHLQLFSRVGLNAVLDRTGFDVRSVASHGVNPYELARRLRGRDGRRPVRGNTETNYRLNESLSSSTRGRAAKRIANTILTATRLGDTLKVVAERRAG